MRRPKMTMHQMLNSLVPKEALIICTT